MRESCLDCVRKHLAQAIILLTEAKLGHPELFWIAIGHLAEAEAESVKQYWAIAIKIRHERHKVTDNEEYDLEGLFDFIDETISG